MPFEQLTGLGHLKKKTDPMNPLGAQTPATQQAGTGIDFNGAAEMLQGWSSGMGMKPDPIDVFAQRAQGPLVTGAMSEPNAPYGGMDNIAIANTDFAGAQDFGPGAFGGMDNDAVANADYSDVINAPPMDIGGGGAGLGNLTEREMGAMDPYDRARQDLERSSRGMSPSAMLAMAAGLLKDTQSGNFSESLGNAAGMGAGPMGQHEALERSRQAELANLEMQRGNRQMQQDQFGQTMGLKRDMFGLDKLRAEQEASLAERGFGLQEQQMGIQREGMGLKNRALEQQLADRQRLYDMIESSGFFPQRRAQGGLATLRPFAGGGSVSPMDRLSMGMQLLQPTQTGASPFGFAKGGRTPAIYELPYEEQLDRAAALGLYSDLLGNQINMLPYVQARNPEFKEVDDGQSKMLLHPVTGEVRGVVPKRMSPSELDSAQRWRYEHGNMSAADRARDQRERIGIGSDLGQFYLQHGVDPLDYAPPQMPGTPGSAPVPPIPGFGSARRAPRGPAGAPQGLPIPGEGAGASPGASVRPVAPTRAPQGTAIPSEEAELAPSAPAARAPAAQAPAEGERDVLTPEELKLPILTQNKIRQERIAARPANLTKLRTALEDTRTVQAKIDEALSKTDSWTPTTGMLGDLAAKWKGSDSYDLRAALKTITSQLAVDAMMALKAASPTGATGFGNMTEKELEVITTKIANLDPNQSKEALKANLEDIRRRFDRASGYTKQAYESIYGPLPDDANAGGGERSGTSVDDLVKKYLKKKR